MAGFAPLGTVLTIVLGAAVAEKSGLFSALIRGSLRNAPRVIMTPMVALIGMVSHHASDAAYVVFIPLAAILYAAVGRHPLVGLAAAFAAVSGGYAGNITPGQIDVLLFGFTQEAARIVEPGWTMNPAGNWWFILAIVRVASGGWLVASCSSGECRQACFSVFGHGVRCDRWILSDFVQFPDFLFSGQTKT